MQTLLNANRGRIRAIIKKMTGRVDEDIEQEVYLKSWEKRDSYQEEGNFKAWISALTVNLCKDYFRTKQYKMQAAAVSEDDAPEIADKSSSAEEVIDQKRRQKLILKAVDSLPSKMRDVVVYVEFEGMSYEEVATRLKISVGTVKSRLFNARSILSEKLAYLKGE